MKPGFSQNDIGQGPQQDDGLRGVPVMDSSHVNTDDASFSADQHVDGTPGAIPSWGGAPQGTPARRL